MKDVYGIDLGTTNSCIAVIGDDGQPEVIKNLDDNYTTPSVVYYDDAGEQYVGSEAKSMMGGDIKRTVAFIKREMSNKNYQRDIDGIIVTPINVSALILKKVVDDANQQREYEGLPPIHKAVVTVPAYFGNDERMRTEQAAKIAGIEVLGLLNEPTAAALNYGTKGLNGKTFLIYDLGGGTFDVSIMRMKDGELDTLSSDGDHHLGGVDWDICLIDYALQKEGLGVSYDDIKDSKEVGKMLIAAEICKKNLSKAEKAAFKFVYQRKQHFIDITRGMFEELTEDLVDRTIQIVEKAKKLALERTDSLSIDDIILVGGSSYMPMIKKRLTEEYPDSNIRLDNLEPDRAVAKGAAIQAAALAGQATKIKLGEDLATRSYGLGANIGDETFHYACVNVIKRTDPLIYEGKHEFCTSVDNQEKVTLELFENISTDDAVELEKCTLLEEKELSWGKAVPKGTEVIANVIRDANGTVKISVSCEGSRPVIFDIKGDGILSEEEIEREKRRLANKHV